MDVEEAACAWMLYRRRQRRKRRQRRHWVHPILHDKLTHGMFSSLYPKLREHEPKFFNYLRMSIKSFDDLLAQIQDDISSTSTMSKRSHSCSIILYCVTVFAQRAPRLHVEARRDCLPLVIVPPHPTNEARHHFENAATVAACVRSHRATCISSGRAVAPQRGISRVAPQVQPLATTCERSHRLPLTSLSRHSSRATEIAPSEQAQRPCHVCRTTTLRPKTRQDTR